MADELWSFLCILAICYHRHRLFLSGLWPTGTAEDLDNDDADYPKANANIRRHRRSSFDAAMLQGLTKERESQSFQPKDGDGDGARDGDGDEDGDRDGDGDGDEKVAPQVQPRPHKRSSMLDVIRHLRLPTAETGRDLYSSIFFIEFLAFIYLMSFYSQYVL